MGHLNYDRIRTLPIYLERHRLSSSWTVAPPHPLSRSRASTVTVDTPGGTATLASDLVKGCSEAWS